MTDPKPTPADIFKKTTEAAENTAKVLKEFGEKLSPSKKPFSRPDHLTHRPFKENEGLRKLQDELNKRNSRGAHNPKAKRQR